MIHPTAVIAPEAKIPASAEIGPHVIVEGPVELGENCQIQANAVITGRVRMGEGNKIGYGAIIGSLPQDIGFKPETPTGVVIGDRNVIREYVTIHRATKPECNTTVGSDNFLMTGSHYAHDVVIGNRCIIANNALLAGHVHFGDSIIVGGGSVFHQFVRIGSFAMIRGISGLGKDLPPYTVAMEVNTLVGLNVIGLRRSGHNAETRAEIKRAFNLLFRDGMNTAQALEEAGKLTWGPEASYFWTFVREAKKRGICKLSRGKEEEE